MLTRSQFDIACKAFIHNYAQIDLAFPALNHWSWIEHASLPGFGYMSKTAVHLRTRDDDSTYSPCVVEGSDIEDSEDAATMVPPTTGIHRSCCYVVYSATFQVPTLYFTIHDSNGSPLQLDEIIKTSLFRHLSLPEAELTSFTLSFPTAAWPLLSQGDHPTLGTPCWYLHPCQTAPAVNEVMKEVHRNDWTNEQYLVRWMEMWFMMVGAIVDLG